MVLLCVRAYWRCHCVCFVSDGGRHGASAVGLRAQGDSVGYVRCSMPAQRLYGRLVIVVLSVYAY